MTLIYKLDPYTVKVNHYTEHLGQALFRSREYTHRQTHTQETDSTAGTTTSSVKAAREPISVPRQAPASYQYVYGIYYLTKSH